MAEIAETNSAEKTGRRNADLHYYDSGVTESSVKAGTIVYNAGRKKVSRNPKG